MRREIQGFPSGLIRQSWNDAGKVGVIEMIIIMAIIMIMIVIVIVVVVVVIVILMLILILILIVITTTLIRRARRRGRTAATDGSLGRRNPAYYTNMYICI